MDKKCVDLTNQLLMNNQIDHPKIKNVNEINSNLLLVLFEKITKHRVTDILLCKNIEDEVHNIQAIIDTLSLDMLGISLSHITGEEIVSGNCFAMYNLLEILQGFSMYLPYEKNKGPLLKRKICRIKKRATHSKFTREENMSSIYDTEVLKSFSLQNQCDIYSNKDRAARGVETSYKETKLSELLKTEKKVPIIKHKTSSSIANQHNYPSKLNLFAIDNRPSSFKASNRKISSVKKIISNSQEYKPSASKTLCKNESNKKIFTEEVEDLMEANLESKVRTILEKNSHQPKASQMRQVQIQTLSSTERKHLSPCKKSFLLPYSLRQKSKSYTSLKRAPVKTDSHQVLKQCSTKKEKSDMEFIQELLQEISGLQHSSALLNHISKKYRQHLMTLHKKILNSISSKPKNLLQAEEAAKRQLILSELLKKEFEQEKYLKEHQEKKMIENKMKYHLRDARLQSAKMKKYCDEFHTEMRKKLQKRNFAQELALENLFKEVLNKQKEHVNLLCQDVKEAGENDARQHLTYLNALENLYQSQYSMISEALTSEKKESREIILANKQEMRLSRRNFEEELKKEIRFMQEVIVNSVEDYRVHDLQV